MKKKILTEKGTLFESVGIPEELKEAYELALKAHQHWLDGRVLDAIEFYQEALRLFQEKGAHKEVANILEALGDMYHQRGRMKEALRAYKACLDICEDFEDELSTAVIAEKIVHVYRRQKEYEKMLPYLYRILEIAEKFGDAHRAARAMVGIGDVNQARGDLQTAKEAYEIALKIYEGMGAIKLAKVVKEGLEQVEEKLKSLENTSKSPQP
jgi:tetratricopeptide (TPR) repeat protein